MVWGGQRVSWAAAENPGVPGKGWWQSLREERSPPARLQLLLLALCFHACRLLWQRVMGNLPRGQIAWHSSGTGPEATQDPFPPHTHRHTHTPALLSLPPSLQPPPPFLLPCKILLHSTQGLLSPTQWGKGLVGGTAAAAVGEGFPGPTFQPPLQTGLSSLLKGVPVSSQGGKRGEGETGPSGRLPPASSPPPSFALDQAEKSTRRGSEGEAAKCLSQGSEGQAAVVLRAVPLHPPFGFRPFWVGEPV